MKILEDFFQIVNYITFPPRIESAAILRRALPKVS